MHPARCHLLRRVPGPRPHPARGSRRAGQRSHRAPAGDVGAPRLPREGRAVRDRRLRQGLQGHLERPHPDRRRDGDPVPAWAAARGHGVLPVPPDRHVQARLPAQRGDARRGRVPRQRRRRALHGALRPDDEGPRLAGRRQPLHLPGGRRGARDRRQGLRPPRRAPPRRRGARPEAPRHERLHPHLLRARAADRSRPDPADRPLRDGRHPDRHRRPRPRRRSRHGDSGALRRRRGGVRIGPWREPARDELAARHPRLRAARREADGRRPRRASGAGRRSRGGGIGPGNGLRPAGRDGWRAPGRHPHRAPGRDVHEVRRLPHRAAPDRGARRGRVAADPGADAPGRRPRLPLQHRPDRRARARLPPRLRRGDRGLGAGPHRVARRPRPRGLPRARRRAHG